MKLRFGFVSNSSTSSFQCSVCGELESGWDLCLSDIEWFECENGHTLCADDADGIFLGEISEELGGEVDRYGLRYDLPEKYCPICRMEIIGVVDQVRYLKKITKISTDEVLENIKVQNKRRKKVYDNEYVEYALGKAGLKLQDVCNEIREKFSSYEEFNKFL